jgi:hypothetical protein
MIEMQRRALIAFLNRTFPKVVITHLPPFEQIVTPLFKIVKFTRDNYRVVADFDNVPSLQLVKYVADRDNSFNTPKSLLPLRWYSILKDFYLPGMEFNHESVDYTDKVNALPDLVVEHIINDAISRVPSWKLTVHHKDWATLDGGRSASNRTPVVDAFFERSASYTCLGGTYRSLCAVEGGISLNNAFVDDFVHLRHSVPHAGSVRNEVKGHCEYTTGKDVLPEELAVMYLIMQKEGIESTLAKVV